ncbi:hypothetical protein [Mycobacterium sp. NAZ190054]|uniref:hypothetical protein n=1 Tax=Mycobacterium sp. NAZ190054 TaxID=1747766 RepID=UPI00079A3435|nr:hypothetical protein [Mycobacterium sp. NAZ190054]KWX62498.1 hypothetical protein ASJ79_08710 [Mycobacterium sp. NAZ190054]
MADYREERALRHLTTPRAAAVAGVLFAVLFGTALVLVRFVMPEGPSPDRWAERDSTLLRIAAILVPFAGISFLWFIGVVRDGFGRYEDRFFASVFIGSGLLFLAMTFAWAAVGGALVETVTAVADPASRAEVAAFGRQLLVTLSQTFALRMASVFMISLATIWLRTGLMPRWLVVTTYATAAVLLVAGELSMWLTLAFPLWVLGVSLLLLAREGVIDLHVGQETGD